MSRESRPGQSRPTAVIVIAPDERSAEILIEGHRQLVTGQAPKETRRAALDVATGYAARIGQPVLIDARDANGYWRLVATPTGVVQAADQGVSGHEPPPPPAPAAAPVSGPETGAQQPEAKGKRKGGRTLVIVGAAVLALVLLAGAGAVAWRFLPGFGAAPGGGATADVTTLNPAPPHFSTTVDFSAQIAPGSQPGVSRRGDLLAYVDPEQRLNLLDADGERLWSVELPVESSEVLGAPWFVQYGGEDAVVMETARTLWFWPVADGDPVGVQLPEAASVQYVGSSVLVRTEDEAFVPIGGELQPVQVPEGSAPMLADGEDVLTAVLHGPWTWVSPDGNPVQVTAQRPDDAGEMESVVTALREYVIVRWEPLRGEGTVLAFHDSQDGSVVGSAQVDPADLEGVRHRSGAIGTRLAAYGPAVLNPENGRTAVVPDLAPDIAVGSLVFGQIDGATVAVDAEGRVEEAAADSVPPIGLLGERAVVVHEGHLYAIPSE
jgi:flagellar basal body-associated protein FliL